MWSELLQTHGYWLLALGCLLEGETVLVLAGFAAHRGLLDPAAVVAVAAASGFAGDEAFFWLGRRHGTALLARWPALARRSARVQRLVERWHEPVIIGIRFAYGLRVAGPVLIGSSAVSARRFALFNALGALLWATLVGAIGWSFGAAAQALLGRLHHLEGRLFLGLLLAALLVALLRHLAARRRP
ncbi:MAG: DedA family protein [Rubrivivax sp.]|nr:DedA family protein [Rubrivivax sp.]